MYVVVPHTASPSLALAASLAGVTWSKAERLSCAGLALEQGCFCCLGHHAGWWGRTLVLLSTKV